MKKIISLFQRNYDTDRLVRNEVVRGAEWVLEGEGFPTQKYDGTACLVRDRKLYKRYDAKAGRKLPFDFTPAQDEPDPITGHYPGWVPVGNGPEDRWHREAWAHPLYCSRAPDVCFFDYFQEWTYELVGPHVQSNINRFDGHYLVPHGLSLLEEAPRSFEGIQEYLAEHLIEGIVWWRNLEQLDCDKVKIKRRDFGLKWDKSLTDTTHIIGKDNMILTTLTNTYQLYQKT